MKITIIGYSGSGKSTLAKTLADHYQLSLLHLDRLQFLPNWQDNDPDKMEQEVLTFLDTKDHWVIDGNYAWCQYERRLEESDWIIFLNFSRWNCLYRAWKRARHFRGQVRDSMATGCIEKLDWEFIRWVLWDGRQVRQVTRYQTVGQTYSDKFIALKNQKELDRFLNKVKNDLLESK